LVLPFPHFQFLKDASGTQIEVEAVDRTGTFIGSLWESKTNMGSVLLEAGLAKLSSFGLDRITDAYVLTRAEHSAKQQKIKVTFHFSPRAVKKGKTITDT